MTFPSPLNSTVQGLCANSGALGNLSNTSCCHILAFAKHLNKFNLRKTLRAQRQALTLAAQQRAEQRLFSRMATHPIFKSARSIGFYLANDGEISPRPLMAHAIEQGKQCYLPVLQKTDQLNFRRYKNTQSMITNQYGIPEPDASCPSIDKLLLDLVLMPLVAFDTMGNRLGMGGGYYDRSFAFKRKYPKRGPLLVGLAHAFQQVEEIDSEKWDIPMSCIATDKEMIWLG